MPRAIFFTLRFKDPRGAVRFAFGAAFLRAARLTFLRSSLLSDFVFAMGELMVNENFVSRLSAVDFRSVTSKLADHNRF